MHIQLRNARIVEENKIRDGVLNIRNGVIESVEDDCGGGEAIVDCGGDLLIAGLVDLHTDNLEHHFLPRPGVIWPCAMTSAMAHDGQILTSGITTVLDAMAIGDFETSGARSAILDAAIRALSHAQTANLLKADHYFHFRCEVSDPALMEMLEPHLDHPSLRLLSIMDHTPGQKQFRDLARYRDYRGRKRGMLWGDEEFTSYIAERMEIQRTYAPKWSERISEAGAARRLPIASHDDTTVEDVERSFASGSSVCEFPTTIEAARHARRLGMQNVMGAPNIVLGGSHSGNVSASALAEDGLLDALTSDYIPASLLRAAFALAESGFALPNAVAMVTTKPAALLGFEDRGRIAPGMRADLALVRTIEKVPIVRGVWVAGERRLWWF